MFDEDTTVTNSLTDRTIQDGRNSRMKMVRCKFTLLLKVTAAVLAIGIVLVIITGLSTYNQIPNWKFKQISKFQDPTAAMLRHVVFEKERNLMIFYDKNNQEHFKIDLRFPGHKTALLKPGRLRSAVECCKDLENKTNQVLCLEFSNQLCAVVVEKNYDIGCYSVQWSSQNLSETDSIEQCFDLKENWYGGGALSEHRWPLNRVNVPMQAYITRQFNVKSDDGIAVFESYLQPYFVSAGGISLILDDYLPLFISINHDHNSKICIKAQFDKPYRLLNGQDHLLLKYNVCKGHTARDIHEQLLDAKILDRPLSSPNLDILQKPVWSTRGISLKDTNEKELLNYIRNLKNSNLSFSQLIIDGNYSRFPGSVYFSEKKFPHSAQLAMELDSALPQEKLKVATEVYPYLPGFMVSKNFSIPNAKMPGHPDFLDLSNQDAVNWFTSQLETMKSQVGIKGFRFSGGHSVSLLQRKERISDLEMKNVFHPNQITNEYGRIAGQFSGNSFLGSGYKSQKHGLVADSGPFLAHWDHHKGLKSVIPTMITYGLLGYPFVSVGPIGGINHFNSSSGHFSLSDRNLFIRWLQLSSFFPVMEFSVGPWLYDNKLTSYTKSLMTYRQNVLWPEYLSPAIAESKEKGIPIIRPLWWIAPMDKTAQFIDCEFMVGNDLLVAPVLYDHLKGRQVYLPKGSMWEDQLRGGKLLAGGQWLGGYRVDEYEIAHFVRVSSS